MLQILYAFECSFEPVSFGPVSLAPSAGPTPLQTHNGTGDSSTVTSCLCTLQVCVQGLVQLTAGPLVLYSTDPLLHRIELFFTLPFHFFLTTTFALGHLIRQMAGPNHNGYILKNKESKSCNTSRMPSCSKFRWLWINESSLTTNTKNSISGQLHNTI